MGYSCETLRDQHHAERELVFRPMYAGHAIGLDHVMFIAAAAAVISGAILIAVAHARLRSDQLRAGLAHRFSMQPELVDRDR